MGCGWPAGGSDLFGRAQIDYPDKDDEEDSDICKVMDGLYIGGALPGLPMCRGNGRVLLRVTTGFRNSALEATQGQNDSLFSQIPYKCDIEELASVGD